MLIAKWFFHIIEALTLDLIPQYFRKYLKSNADNSGVFNNAERMVSKKQELVFYPIDSSIDHSVWKEKINSENYYRQLGSSLFAHILSLFIVLLANVNLVSSIVLYVVIAVVVKFLASVYQAVHVFVAKKFEASDDRVALFVEGGLGKYSTVSDKKNAIPYVDSFQGEISQKERMLKNSDFIKDRLKI